MLRFIFTAIPLLVAGGYAFRELKLLYREMAWQRRRKLLDALHIALHYRAEQRDQEAAEREAFDRKLKGEDDDGTPL